MTLLEPFGPIYPDLGPSVAKYRRKANMTLGEKLVYGEAVHNAILAKQRQELNRAAVPGQRPNCASGTWHTDGKAIHKAVRKQQESDLQSCAGKERRARTPDEWQAMYDRAMAEKPVTAETALRYRGLLED